ncbi:hypothetical protein GGD81_004766 [Rhodobium orientis]|uniref:Uncharacterized protein n=1 Tax=Rhodobium orientis TaxID=34017 RepID=A0A327JH38_9HYPH|nr:hypothetical protein [Rhodobium orientis]MBB4305684.1 hypothetical protein [Rhodobium orientis]MBK5948422.1 hypothetical protein [Rhodobium orientis]RAI24604.1 hypothetical protein CH339_21930 [Rhodobium orientis]
MTIRHHPFATALLVAASLGLAGCSGEPDEDDMEEALRRDPMMSRLAEVTANQPVPQGRETTAEAYLDSLSVNKSGCAEARGAPGYVCDFKMTIGTNRSNMRSDRPGKGRFFQADDGWTYQEMR